MSNAIAIVGMACEYPDAHDPSQLWENVLAQRRAFRRLPAERMRVEDYFSTQKEAPDATYSAEAAVIADYHFDRVAFRVVGSTYEVTDPAHWLALDVASRALADAGFPAGEGLPRERAGVFVGNTLTGDHSRACVLRLRWPYVRRVMAAALESHGLRDGEQDKLLEEIEARYKAPFPAINEESLAGSLSNTIGGRICGHFDFKGGGYSLDGACASSLLAVASACDALQSRRIDVAIAGGVDLSLDPFELVGFAKAGALAGREMRVFDAEPEGFWPGEGCGFVVLMREPDVLLRGAKAYARICGWGISSDGRGGITRPELDGQLLALRRAYEHAGYAIATVDYLEAHGTGTEVGDATELQALCTAREGAPRPAAIGSIKANIGHTKAAAGVAGLIKAALVLHHRMLPPMTGCREPQRLLAESSVLQIAREASPLPPDRPVRAGVSALGFGGINTHLALESAGVLARLEASVSLGKIANTAQDCELFLFAGSTYEELLPRVAQVAGFAARLSRSELTDLAMHLQRLLPAGATLRAAVVAATPSELAAGLARIEAALREGGASLADFHAGVFLDARTVPPQVGLLFPGQGHVPNATGGIFARRFDAARQVYRAANLEASTSNSHHAAAHVQPALIAAALAGHAVLEQIGFDAALAVGHSLGELAALHWSGVVDVAGALRIAVARGRAMAGLRGAHGAMAALDCPASAAEAFLNGTPVVIAARNSSQQTVVSGPEGAIATVIERARSAGTRSAALNVTHAFHSPLIAPAAEEFRAFLAGEPLRAPSRRVISTVTGGPVATDADLREHLIRQLTSPVEFMEAFAVASREVNLFIEVGPGRTLAGLAAASGAIPVVSLEVGGESLKGLLTAAGWAYARGLPIDWDCLFGGRFARPFNLDWHPDFLASPCEKAPIVRAETPKNVRTAKNGQIEPGAQNEANDKHLPEMDRLRALVARRARFPVELIGDDTRLLKDLNLNSMVVAEIAVRGARLLGRRPPADASAFAKASFAELAAALMRQPPEAAQADLAGMMPAGIRPWMRAFCLREVEMPPAAPAPVSGGAGDWYVIAPVNHPLAPRLREALGRLARSGIAVIVPDDSEEHLPLLLEGARRVAQSPPSSTFVLVSGRQAHCASFARSLHLELPVCPVCIVSGPLEDVRCVDWIVREAGATQGFNEAIYDDAGVRSELRLFPQSFPGDAGELPLDASDVVLVTGGGKGITAECALALAASARATFALAGRADPRSDAELARNLGRFAAQGCRHRYWRADLSKRDEAHRLAAEIERDLGPITAIVHGAGTNVPASIGELTVEAVRRTLAAKVHGLEALLAAVSPQTLRLLVSFGSIIGRSGFEGNADYALANERLTALTESHGAKHRHCRCLALEWSAWSGLGMAEKIGLAALQARGVEPIPVEQGVAMFLRLLRQDAESRSVIVSGRFGEPPTLKLAAGAPHPRFRFLEHVHMTPGIELIAEAQLSCRSDPYLEEHIFSEQRLLPAVMALEAMAEAATVLSGNPRLPVFENVQLDRTVAVPPGEAVTLRVLAQTGLDGTVELVLRSSESGYAFDHFRAVCRFDDDAIPREAVERDARAAVALDPRSELYGPLLFHTGRFQRVTGYRKLAARECVATIGPAEKRPWFELPSASLALGDAAARDAALHAIQACIPHRTVLPVGCERMLVSALPAGRELTVHAHERARDGDLFTYDVLIADDSGRVLERWTGLRLKAIAPLTRAGPWPEPLLRTYFERRLEELELRTVAGVAVVTEEADSLAASTRAIREALGKEIAVRRDERGRPSVDADCQVTAAHAGQVSVGAAAMGLVGCDVEPVRHRAPSEWVDLLGKPLAELAGSGSCTGSEDFDHTATRLWTARECLIKAGVPVQPLRAGPRTDDGWMVFALRDLRIATWIGRLRSAPDVPLAFAFLAESGAAPAEVERRIGQSLEAEFRHIVGFEESNLVGNVYFAHYLRWQESARDAWLRQHAAEALGRLHAGELVVSASRCDFERELFPGDELRVTAACRRDGDELDFAFTYWRGDAEIAAGSQRLGALTRGARSRGRAADAEAYEYRHAVTFEETQSTGCVHHLNYFRWQGSCRELFLRDFAPDILRRLSDSLCLVTKETSCEIFGELAATDDVIVRMRLEEVGEFSVGMHFEYWRVRDSREQLVATGGQTILVMERTDSGKIMAPVPESLRHALQPYTLPRSPARSDHVLVSPANGALPAPAGGMR